jgi:hypothetical protein
MLRRSGQYNYQLKHVKNSFRMLRTRHRTENDNKSVEESPFETPNSHSQSVKRFPAIYISFPQPGVREPLVTRKGSTN